MTKLNQLVAIEKDVKIKASDTITDAYHQIKKSELFEGLTKTYQPGEDGGEQYPAENKKVQLTVESLFAEIVKTTTRLFDVIATKDYTNTIAKASVKLPDGTVLVKDAPVPFLLFLEKQLIDIRTFVSKMPRLDPAFNWTFNENSNCYAADPVQSPKNKKVATAFMRSPATPQHPAQVDRIDVDVMQGMWTKIEFSGAIPESQAVKLDERVVTLIEAVRFAREEANLLEVQDQKVGAAILDYIFKA